jgi:hypothetical protein
MILNPNHISGIYNYCDRWCERCTFTSRCPVFESEQNLSTEKNDICNKAFWDNISKVFAEGILMMQKSDAEHGLELNNIDTAEMKAYEVNRKKGREEMKKHPLIKYAAQYMKEAKTLLNSNSAFKDKGEQDLQLIQLGIKDAKKIKTLFSNLIDNLEVIQWYLIQIQVKFMRALPTSDDDKDFAFSDDSNCSAKVALIATDRCLVAWQNIMMIMPELQDEIIPLLSLLQKIKKIGDITFPKAMTFIRPGLDE